MFFALWPDVGVRGRLRALAQAMHKDSGGRLIRPDHLHLTLVFLGNVARARTSQLDAIARQQCGAGFNLEFSQTGLQFDRRVHQNEHKNERKNEYVPHVTLIRDAPAPAAFPMPQFGWPVSDFALIESARGAKGAEYRVLARWPLACQKPIGDE